MTYRILFSKNKDPPPFLRDNDVIAYLPAPKMKIENIVGGKCLVCSVVNRLSLLLFSFKFEYEIRITIAQACPKSITTRII